MTLSELIRTLPYGFHDSEMESLHLDYVRREAILKLNVWIGDMSSSDEKERDRRSRGTLTISGLIYFIIEPPSPTYPYHEAGVVWIDMGDVSEMESPPEVSLPRPLPPGASENWIYCDDWNSCMYVAAMDARFDWDDPAVGIRLAQALEEFKKTGQRDG